MRAAGSAARLAALDHAHRRATRDNGLQSENENTRSATNLRATLADGRVAHAWIKERCGLRQFRCRGRLKATMEATWACLTYNLMRWFGLRRAPQAQPAAIG